MHRKGNFITIANIQKFWKFLNPVKRKSGGGNGVARSLLTPQYEPAPRRPIWIWKVCHSLLGLQILKYFVMWIPWTTIFQILEFKFSTFSKFWMEIFEIGRLGAASFWGVIISSSYCGVKSASLTLWARTQNYALSCA